MLAITLFSGCVTTGSKNMETVVTDMHKRVDLLDQGMAGSLAQLNETTVNLMARVNENEEQVRLLKSLMEENQRKLDNLLNMVEALRKTLYRHWGLTYTAPRMPRPASSVAQTEAPMAPSRSEIVMPAETAQPAASEAAPPLQAAPSPAGDESAYTAAKERYDSEDYAGAVAAFTSFLSDYPQSVHRHKAQFWVGKSLLNQSEYSKAIEAFETVRRDYPDSSYMPFVLHNQAVAHYRLGDKAVAIALMEEVVANYPTSTASEHARRDLEQLRSGRL